MRRFTAELLGTYWLVFAGTGAIVVHRLHPGVITHPGVALTFGLVVLAVIHAFGEISGAHCNPAVTVAFAAAGRFAWAEVPGYVGAQGAGALLASLTLRVLFPSDALLGATLPSGAAGQSFVLELLLTCFLMLVILQVSSGAREQGITAGIVIGGVVGLEAMWAGPVCGASMNPARSFGPALAAGHLEHLWIYLTAPVAGALLAVPLHRWLRPASATATVQPS